MKADKKFFGFVFLFFLVIILFLFAINGSSPQGFSLVGSEGFSYVYEYRDESYTAPLYVGDLKINSVPLQFKCPDLGVEKGFVTPDESPAECWMVVLEFNEEYYDMKAGGTVDLNDYLEVTFVPSGKVWFGEHAGYDYIIQGEFLEEIHRKSTFNFKFKQSPISITIPKQQSVYNVIGDGKTLISFNVDNKLANNLRGGIIKKIRYNIFGQEAEEVVPYTYKEGEETYEVEIPTGILGKVELVIQPYFDVNGERFVGDKKSIFVYNVVPAGVDVSGTSTDTSCITDIDCPEGFYCKDIDFRGHKTSLCTAGDRQQEGDIGVVLNTAISLWQRFINFIRGIF